MSDRVAEAIGLVYITAMPFYEALRAALSTYESGIHWVGKSASHTELSRMEQRVGCPIPASYQDFLCSFNGASLFHESIQLFATASEDLSYPMGGYLRIGEIPQGRLWMDFAGTIQCVDESSVDLIVIGSSLEQFLEAMIARESLIIDLQGEFREVFDEEGDLTPKTRLKQAKAGQKRDPKVPFYLYEQAELSIIEGETEAATTLLKQAVELDPKAGPCLELLGSIYRERQQIKQAEQCFVNAAKAALDPMLKASRWSQAAFLADLPDRATYLKELWAENPNYAETLVDQVQSLLKDSPEEAQKRAAELQMILEYVPIQLKELSDKITQKLLLLEKQLRIRSRLSIL